MYVAECSLSPVATRRGAALAVWGGGQVGGGQDLGLSNWHMSTHGYPDTPLP